MVSYLCSLFLTLVSCWRHQPLQEEQKEEAALEKEPEVAEEAKKEESEKKEEPAEQKKEDKGKEAAKEEGKKETKKEAKKEKPAKDKNTDKKAEEPKGSKRQKTMQCKVTLLDDTQFECELDVRNQSLCMCNTTLKLNWVIMTDGFVFLT